MIFLIPIGPVPIHLLSWLFDRLGVYVNRTVEVGKAIPLPKTGFSPERKQYDANAVMDILDRINLPEAERLVGIIDYDCFSDGLNFIFGQARINGRELFVALPRLRPCFYGLPEDKNQLRQRVLKEVIHELGHSWGANHCRENQCVMHFSSCIDDTDQKRPIFCPHCREGLSFAEQ